MLFAFPFCFKRMFVCMLHFFSLTLHYDVGSGMDGVHVIAGVARVLASIALVDILDEKSSRGCDADARIGG